MELGNACSVVANDGGIREANAVYGNGNLSDLRIACLDRNFVVHVGAN